MNGDEERPDTQDAIERQLTPLVLDSFAQIARLAADFEAVRLRCLAAMLRNEEVPEEAERAGEEFRREFVGLMQNIHLNRLRIDQLTAQIEDLTKRLARGDVEAVVTEARMSPDELRLLAANTVERDLEAVPTDAASESTARILASLTPREERVLRMRFGADIKTDHTLEEVVRQFSVTRERIRQIEAKALRKLKGKAGRAEPSSTKPADWTSRKNGHASAKRIEADAGKRIESGRTKAIEAIYESPLTMDAIVQWRECLLQGVMRLRDVIDLDAAYSAYRLRGDGNGQDDEGSDD